MSQKILYQTETYMVVATDNAIGEDGTYGVPGYAVVNKETTVVEHTTMILPQAIYQAQGFTDALDAQLAEPEAVTPLSLVGDTPEDVVPN